MPKYMIQLMTTPDDYITSLKKHEPNAVDFLPQVFWGRMQDNECGWAIVDAASESEARDSVPESIRDKVMVSEIHNLIPEMIEPQMEAAQDKVA